MVDQSNDNTLILGGFKFSKMQNRRKGILVSSIDPQENLTCVVVSSSKQGSQLNGSNHGNDLIRSRIKKRDIHKDRANKELEAKALLFCRVANKLMQRQNSSTFVGHEVIYKMVSNRISKNRAEALALGKELSKKLRLFYRVDLKRNTFSDDAKRYKFRPEVLLSVITKSPMCILKQENNDKTLEKSKSTAAGGISYSPTKFRKSAEPSKPPEKTEIKVQIDRITGKPKRKGRRPSIESVGTSASEVSWKRTIKCTSRAAIVPIRENEEYSKHDDRSVYTEITVSEHTGSDAASFPPVPSIPQHEEEEASYMDFTISTRSRDSNSYFEEFTLEDEDEYDIMSVPTTPVVRKKLTIKAKDIDNTANDLFSPNDVATFDKRVSDPKSQNSTKTDQLSLSTRMRRGDLAIEVPYLEEMVDEDDFIIDDM